VTDDSPLVYCIDAAGQPYALPFSRVREASGAPRFRIRDVEGTVHQLAHGQTLRDSLGLGKLSLAEFECCHPLSSPGQPTYPGTNIVRPRAWLPVRLPRAG
jgi:hypothetical protein